jgi:hypothetical protein
MLELLTPYAIFWMYTIVGTVALYRGRIYFHNRWQLKSRPACWYGGMLLLFALPFILLVGAIVDRFVSSIWDLFRFDVPREVVYGVPQLVVFLAALVGAVAPFRSMEEHRPETISVELAWRFVVRRIVVGVALGLAGFQQALALYVLLMTALDIRTLPGGATSAVPPEAPIAVYGLLCSVGVGALLGFLWSTLFASPGRGQGMWLGTGIGLLAGFAMSVALAIPAQLAIPSRDSSLLIRCLFGSAGCSILGGIVGGALRWKG